VVVTVVAVGCGCVVVIVNLSGASAGRWWVGVSGTDLRCRRNSSVPVDLLSVSCRHCFQQILYPSSAVVNP
jgi:hypothetical protein